MMLCPIFNIQEDVVKVKDALKEITIIILVVFSLFAQTKNYGALEEKVSQNEKTNSYLTKEVSLLRKELAATNCYLSKIVGKMEVGIH